MDYDKKDLRHWSRIVKKGDTVVLELETSGVSDAALKKLVGLNLKAYKYSSSLVGPSDGFFAAEPSRGAFFANAGCRVYIGGTKIQFFEYGDRASNESRYDDFYLLSTLLKSSGFELHSWTLAWQIADTGERETVASGKNVDDFVALLAAPRART